MVYMSLTPSEIEALLISLRASFFATLFGLPFAILIAYVLARFRFPGHGLLNVVVHLPLVLPPVVTGYLLLLTLGRKAPLGAALETCCGIVFSFRWTGAALAAGIMAFPLIVRAVRLSIEAVDPRLEQSALTLGAHPVWVFLTITLPLALPGIVAGAILGFAKALGEFGATITFVSNIPGETQTLPSAIYSYTQIPNGDGPALRLVIIAIVISMAALFASEAMARRVKTRIIS
jgi:molybdate transport system permease protein